MTHLTDEQLAAWLTGEPLAEDAELHSHLRSCESCRAEATALRDRISRYSLTLHQAAARSQRAHMSTAFAPQRALLLHRLRWAGAGVLALVLAVQTAWMLKPRPPAPSQPVAAIPANSQPASPMSDDELLEAVSNDLNREVPQALAPVSAITAARNQIAAASTGRNQ
jgi:hypothetical protein